MYLCLHMGPMMSLVARLLPHVVSSFVQQVAIIQQAIIQQAITTQPLI